MLIDAGRMKAAQREYYDLNTRLNNEILGLLPHEGSPIWAARFGPPPASLFDDAAWTRLDCREQWSRESFVRAWKLAGMLDAAAQAQHKQQLKPTPAKEYESP